MRAWQRAEGRGADARRAEAKLQAITAKVERRKAIRTKILKSCLWIVGVAIAIAIFGAVLYYFGPIAIIGGGFGCMLLAMTERQ